MSYRLRGTTSQRIGFFASADVPDTTKPPTESDYQRELDKLEAKDKAEQKEIDKLANKMMPLYISYSLLSAAGASTGAYHGYIRGGVGGAILWFLLGGMFPFATIPISLAQGFGKPKQ